MPTVANRTRATGEDTAMWRGCTSCGVLAANPPELYRCNLCQTEPTRARWRLVLRRLADRGRF